MAVRGTGRAARTAGGLARGVAPLLAAVLLAGCATPADEPPRATAAPVTAAPVTAGPPVPGPVRPEDTPAPDGAAPAGPDGAPALDAARRWRPGPGLSWQWQLSGAVNLRVPADVYDLDYQTTSAGQVAALHRAGRRVICYVNAGAYEAYRPDAARFPAAVLGRPLAGWPDERWLDVRRWHLIEPLLGARVRICRAKGFDAIEPDNLDAYRADSGFPIRAADQLTFNRRVANLAHRYGLAVGLKNDLDQVRQLVSSFDFAVNEQCAAYRECARLTPFVRAGKAVFHAEYALSTREFCPGVRALGLSSIRKRQDLDVWREAC